MNSSPHYANINELTMRVLDRIYDDEARQMARRKKCKQNPEKRIKKHGNTRGIARKKMCTRVLFFSRAKTYQTQTHTKCAVIQKSERICYTKTPNDDEST